MISTAIIFIIILYCIRREIVSINKIKKELKKYE